MPHLFSPAKIPPQFIPRDACCAQPARVPVVVTPARRTRLAELDANIHCSIVGTCLTTAELRKLIARYVPDLARKDATDVEIHHAAVNLSTEGGIVAKELNKALDTRHALAIKKFKLASDERGLQQLWQEAMAHGDVPGAYWALMTHPDSTFDVRTLAFGDVHMLSHLVGASNRADLRRLTALEEENTRLKQQHAGQQARINTLATEYAGLLATMQQLQARCDQQVALAPLLEEVAQLRAALRERDDKLALHTARRQDSEQKSGARLAGQDDLHAALLAARAELKTAQAELIALEETLADTTNGGTGKAALPRLDGKCILYVGGRPGSNQMLVQLVASAGGELLVHDGGIEDRHGLLAAMLPRADLVVFPIDCISHNAMHIARQACARQNIACHPLRSASVASFVTLLQRLAEPVATE